jgi:RNase P/RNase MRP subunit p29
VKQKLKVLLQRTKGRKKLNPEYKNLGESIMPVKDIVINSRLKVIHSSDPSLISKIGIVIDETRNTLKIRDQMGKELTIPKKDCLLEFQMKHNIVKVSGADIYGTISERIYKL